MPKILIASSNPWSFAMAVERDIARAHEGARVDVLDLYKLAASFSPHWRPTDRVIERLNRKIGRFVVPVATGRDITPDMKVADAAPPAIPRSVPELRQYAIGEARVGLSVLGSITGITTVQNPIDFAEYGPGLGEAWRSAHRAEQIGRQVRDMGYDEVHIFNGRHCYSRPFCDIVQTSAPVFRYEQGGTGNRYVSSAAGVHAPEALVDLVRAHDFDAADGERFFTNRLEKAPGDPARFFTGDQQPGLLPAGLGGRPIVAFFPSSSDEMYAVADELGYGGFPSQYAVARALADATRALGFDLVIRFHPHLRYKHSSWRREWEFDALARDGVALVWPDDPVDTYALIAASRAVVTTGSTVGFEASFLGVPSIEVGASVGGLIGATALARDADDLAAFLRTPVMPAGSREATILYGSYCRRAGKLLPELEIGEHPDYARIGGRIVDPVRYLNRTVRSRLRPSEYTPLPPGGKVTVEPTVLEALRKQGAGL